MWEWEWSVLFVFLIEENRAQSIKKFDLDLDLEKCSTEEI